MTRTSTQDLQEDFLTALRKGQQTMIGALRIWVETVQAVTPKLSGAYAPLTGKLPQLPNVGMPFADKLPSPKEAVDSAYELAEELLANQRKFAEAVLDTTAPLMPGHEHNGRNHAILTVAPKPVVIKAEPRPAEPKPAETKPAAVVPAPQRVVVKPEPKPAVVVKPEPKPAVVVKPEPKPAVVVKPEPKPAAPKAAAPRKAAPRKAAAPKAAAPKRTAPRTKSADAS
jgi:outer membrane biosynthesis protein TonB